MTSHFQWSFTLWCSQSSWRTSTSGRKDFDFLRNLTTTPPKFNSSPLKKWWERKIAVLLGWLIFRAYVKLPGSPVVCVVVLSLKLTNHPKIGRSPKGNDHLPTTNFQGKGNKELAWKCLDGPKRNTPPWPTHSLCLFSGAFAVSFREGRYPSERWTGSGMLHSP